MRTPENLHNIQKGQSKFTVDHSNAISTESESKACLRTGLKETVSVEKRVTILEFPLARCGKVKYYRILYLSWSRWRRNMELSFERYKTLRPCLRETENGPHFSTREV